MIEDLGSSNGTYLNGSRVMEPQDRRDRGRGPLRRPARHRRDEAACQPRNAPRASGATPDSAGSGQLLPGDPAGLGWRLLAAVADALFFAAGCVAIWAPWWLTLLVERYFLAPDTLPPTVEVKAMIKGACLALLFLLGFLYFVHGWARRGGSPGMKLFRLRLLDWRHRAPIGYSRALLRLAARRRDGPHARPRLPGRAVPARSEGASRSACGHDRGASRRPAWSAARVRVESPP